jgi:hypothetical protein
MDYATRDLIGHLFAIVTARLEDAASLAVDGQTVDATMMLEITSGIRQKIDDVQMLIGAIDAARR